MRPRRRGSVWNAITGEAVASSAVSISRRPASGLDLNVASRSVLTTGSLSLAVERRMHEGVAIKPSGGYLRGVA